LVRVTERIEIVLTTRKEKGKNMKAKDQKEMTSKPVSKVSGPPEEAVALTLRAQVEAFNADAASRRALSDDDRRILDEIGSGAHELYREIRAAWSTEREWVNDEAERLGEEVVGAAADYISTSTSTAELTLSSGLGGTTKKVPVAAIESDAVRALVAQQGDALVRAIDDALAAAHGRIAAVIAAKSRLAAKVDYWLENPAVRSLVVALVAIHEVPGLESVDPAVGIVDSLRRVQLFFSSHGVPEPLYVFPGAWQKWLPVARERLEATKRNLPPAA
jgi:hypothetical protein